MKGRVLKNREATIKREIEELFFKDIILSTKDMDKFEQKDTKKIRITKNTFHDWFTNYIPELLRKSVCGLKYKVVSLFKRSTTKRAVYGRGKKLKKRKTQNIRNPLTLTNKKWN